VNVDDGDDDDDSNSWWLFLLILVIVAIGGYYFWRYKKMKRDEEAAKAAAARDEAQGNADLAPCQANINPVYVAEQENAQYEQQGDMYKHSDIAQIGTAANQNGGSTIGTYTPSMSSLPRGAPGEAWGPYNHGQPGENPAWVANVNVAYQPYESAAAAPPPGDSLDGRCAYPEPKVNFGAPAGQFTTGPNSTQADVPVRVGYSYPAPAGYPSANHDQGQTHGATGKYVYVPP
jgi:LPXTG-motif cell wall-anchored protein